jgi:hypothetical protein
MPMTFRWGLQRPDLVRYNRIEGLSVGARGQALPSTPLGPLSLTMTVRVASAELEPDARVDATKEGLEHRIAWSAFHELAPVSEGGGHLRLGNSAMAALFGRDDGDYYRRSGVSMEWSPPSFVHRAFVVRGYVEHHRPVETATDFAVWRLADDSWAFRDNLAASEGWELGGLVGITPWWGSDPRSVQGGVGLMLQGAGGTVEYARTSLEGRVVFPLPSDFWLRVEVAGGSSWGELPPQRLWLMGGATTLRGYGPRAMEGPSFWRSRGALARRFAFGALYLFSDASWAGERDRVRLDDALHSAGVGLSLADGLIRMDAAWGLRRPKDFRLEAYLDGIL